MKDHHWIMLTVFIMFAVFLIALSPKTTGGWIFAIAIGLFFAVLMPALYYPIRHRKRKAFSKMFDEEMERRNRQS